MIHFCCYVVVFKRYYLFVITHAALASFYDPCLTYEVSEYSRRLGDATAVFILILRHASMV